MSDYDIHSCGYYCDRPACIKAQRNELRDKLFSEQCVKTYSGGKPNYTEPEEILTTEKNIQTSDNKQAESTQTKGFINLTNDEIDDIWAKFNDGRGYIIDETLWGYERALEAKLKEKHE